MKRITLSFIFLGCIITFFAQNLRVIIDYNSYCTPDGIPYLEISTFVDGQTATYIADEQGKFYAEIHIAIQAFQDDTLIDKLDFILTSESFEDSTTSTKPDFCNIQHFQLSNGEYLLQLSAKDLHSEKKPLYYVDLLNLNYLKGEVAISDISLYESISRTPQGGIFDKYGLSLQPLFYDFIPESMYNVPFSCEIYNTDKLANNEPITIKSYITNFENNLMPYPEAQFITHTKAKPIVVTFGEIGIFKLPSGNYNLIVDVLYNDTVLLATNSLFFQRSNPELKLEFSDFNSINIDNSFVEQIKDTAQLLEYVRFLYPICTTAEREFYTFRMKIIPPETLKKFFYAFWMKRDPYNPEKAWTEYLTKIKQVNKMFGDKIVQGYRTDRGRVYLQYGPPNSIFESPYDSHSYPYEVWHYYYCVDQGNVKFIFINTDLVSNDYELIHSDKKGEPQDPFWQLKVTHRKPTIYNFDEREPEQLFGGNPKDDWKIHR